VRLLRQTRQTDEAIRWLDELARRSPLRAREAHIQMADIELGRYEDGRALEHAEQAARLAPGDGQALARIAEVQERAGELDRALATYRRAFDRDGSPPAAFALARLLVRRGATREAAEILRTVLRTAPDEETVTEAARRAIDLEEYLGTLGELERMIAGLIFSPQKGTAYRHALVEVFRRLVPALYRAPNEPGKTAEDRSRLAQHGLRPLLELATTPETEPDRTLIDLLGMLGNRDAAPVLARFAQVVATPGGTTPPSKGAAVRPVSRGGGDVRLAAVIALGRLGDPRGRQVLESLVTAGDSAIRTASVWALGRIPSADSAGLLVKALADPRADTAAVACLGVGRLQDPRWTQSLASVLGDASRSGRVRRAAALGLGLSGDRAAVSPLLAALDSGDDELARAASAALAGSRDRQALAALLERALLPRRPRNEGDLSSLAALDRFVNARPLEDEATAIEGNRLDVEVMLAAMLPPSPRSPPVSLWIDRTRETQDVLADALARSRDWKIRALVALDSREDGPGLGRLAPMGTTEITPAAAAGVREIGAGLKDRVAALLEDPDPEIQALAMRVSAKLGDSRINAVRIASAAGATGTAQAFLPEAAAFVARWQARTQPAAASSTARAMAPLLADVTSWERRLSAVTVLRQLGLAGRRQLEAALADDSPLVRTAAAEGLAGFELATPALVLAASDATVAVRAAVARALAGRSSPSARAALARLARDDAPAVREAAAAHAEP
jgi:HEAT repeat protein